MATTSDSVREIFKGLGRLLGLARSLYSPDQEETIMKLTRLRSYLVSLCFAVPLTLTHRSELTMITAPTLRLTKPIPG